MFFWGEISFQRSRIDFRQGKQNRKLKYRINIAFYNFVKKSNIWFNVIFRFDTAKYRSSFNVVELVER